MSGKGPSGTTLFVASVGIVFAYAGLKGNTVGDTAKAFIAGQWPTGTAATAVSPSGGTSGGAAAVSGGWQGIFGYITSKGWFNTPQTCGIIGNMHVETGGTFDPAIVNGSEGAIGLCQWEGGRRTRLQNFATARNTHESDLTTQLDYMWYELTNFEQAALAAMKVQFTAGGAAAVWDDMYERSAHTTHQERIDIANSVYASLAHG